MIMCSSTWRVANSLDPDQTPFIVASDPGLHYLLRPVCPSIWGRYGRPFGSDIQLHSDFMLERTLNNLQ